MGLSVLKFCVLSLVSIGCLLGSVMFVSTVLWLVVVASRPDRSTPVDWPEGIRSFLVVAVAFSQVVLASRYRERAFGWPSFVNSVILSGLVAATPVGVVVGLVNLCCGGVLLANPIARSEHANRDGETDTRNEN